MSCCTPFPGGQVDVLHTIINVGGQAEWYVIGTGPDPFEIRTAESSDGSIGITQNPQTIDFVVDFDNNVTMINVGGFVEVYKNTTGPNPFELRTFQSTTSTVRLTQNPNDIDLEASSCVNIGNFAEVYVTGTDFDFEFRSVQSSDGSVIITQNATNLDFKVVNQADPGFDHFQVDSLVTFSTGSNVYQTVTILAGDAKVKNGSVWKINNDIKICHPVGLTTVNTWVRWQIETALNTWSTINEFQYNWPISITAGQPSTPSAHHVKVNVVYNTPRCRVQMRMGSVVATGALVEEPRWGGDLITPAP